MTTKTDIYGGRDPRDIATYTVMDAARFLKLPPSTLRQWIQGGVYRTPRQGEKRAQPVIRPSGHAPVLMSFWNLSEAYVLAGIRRYHHVSLQSVRKALEYVERRLGHDRPLIKQDFLTNGADLFIEKLEQFADDPGVKSLVNASKNGQLAARELIGATLRRVSRDPKGLIKLIHPWVNDLDEPRDVEIDPRRAFGRPVVTGTRVPTEELADRFGAGDSIEAISDDFGLTPGAVQSAIRWEMETSRRAAAA